LWLSREDELELIFVRRRLLWENLELFSVVVVIIGKRGH
jgi:hypothetical protein